MSIKKIRPRRTSQPSSNLTTRIVNDRMGIDRMGSDKMGPDKMIPDTGTGRIGGQRPSGAPSNAAKKK